MSFEAAYLPVIALTDAVVFPRSISSVYILRERAVAALETAMESGDKRAFFVLAKHPAGEEEDGEEESLRLRGTIGEILQATRSPEGAARALVEGLSEAVLVTARDMGGWTRATVETHRTRPEPATRELSALRRAAESQFKTHCELSETVPEELIQNVISQEDSLAFIYQAASQSRIDLNAKQAILEEATISGKLRLLLSDLRRENEMKELENQILDQARAQVGQAQREYFLNEQLKVIERELGNGEEDSEIAEIKRKLEKLPLSEEARAKIDRELRRLEKMPPVSPEATVARTYIDTILDLPWGVRTDDNMDLARAQRILDEDHYGLEKVKERMIEFLAVARQVGAMRGPALCLVGPPGVGKTSLARSVARALGRKFTRAALGGVRDEAEIRGHRRTYIGSMPGKIIQGMKKAGSMNPVFLLDEIDKMSSDFRGDPSAALLETLDREHNNAFVDHYLEIDFDLSGVLFFATANTSASIPAPLLDRMEVIRLPGYTEEEKVMIGSRFLFPKQRGEHGIKKGDLVLTESSARYIVNAYTREAGVRELERCLAKICRKSVRERLEWASANGETPAPPAEPLAADAEVLAPESEILDEPEILEEAEPSAADEKVSAETDTQPVAALLPEPGPFPPAKTLTRVRVRRLLGPERHKDASSAGKVPEVGAAMGLAWTEAGGELLPVESLIMPGQGKLTLTLTGKLGEVMQESARAALAYIRANWERLGADQGFYLEKDLHVHVPEGAIPKDGPSAGLALLCSMASALSGRPARQDVAMTGEITLRGSALRVGGVKEKVLAARRHGLRAVILPADNMDDLEEIPASVRQAIEFHPVRTVAEAMRIVFSDAAPLTAGGKPKRPTRKSKLVEPPPVKAPQPQPQPPAALRLPPPDAAGDRPAPPAARRARRG
jgi:ATP-dependent Lon protease